MFFTKLVKWRESMPKYLVIVESPAKAKTIERFLGKDYKIAASMGHVMDLPKSQLGVDIENNFQPKYIPIRGKGEILKRLKNEAQKVEKVFLATDPDREGEAISWHLASLLELNQDEKLRITFNEITSNAVKSAIKSPREININLVEAQQARRILDRIVGYKISPFLWKKVKRGLSAGRVQSVAVRLVVEREEEIEKFVPEEYWTLTATLIEPVSGAQFQAKFYGLTEEEKLKISSKEHMDSILNDLDGAKYVVVKVKKGERKKTPPPPFITSTLQQEASRKLGFPISKTMIIAQQLYEGIDVKGVGRVGLITYMRTDSTRVSIEAQTEARKFITERFGTDFVPEEPRKYKSKPGVQDAHEAIRPTHVDLEPEKIKDSLTLDQYKIYKLIWERFIASQMESAIYDTLTVDISASKYIFRANGVKNRFPGFMIVYIEGKDEEDEEQEEILPDIKENMNLDLVELEPKQHFTQPPSRYTEATLVKALEEKGIGRPSTYAPIMATILERGYVEKNKKFLVPTELGKAVTELLKKHFKDIIDVGFTAQMEEQLDRIEEGNKNWVELLKEFYFPFSLTLEEAEKQVEHIKIHEEETNIPCEKCGKMMVIRQGKFGKFLACPGFPECKNTKPLLEEVGIECPNCKGKVVVRKTKKGKKYYGCENNPECKFMTWDLPVKERCPECGSFLLKKKGKKDGGLVCSNSSCNYIR